VAPRLEVVERQLVAHLGGARAPRCEGTPGAPLRGSTGRAGRQRLPSARGPPTSPELRPW
jgi:hypothetical protein